MTIEQYDLTRMIHFVNKLEMLIENCPRTLRNEDAQLRVSVPEHQTKDAIKEIKLHLDKVLKQNEKLSKEPETNQTIEIEYNEEKGINTRPTKLDYFFNDEDGHTYVEVPIGVAVRLVAGAKKRSKQIRGKDQEKLIKKYGLEESESRRMKLLHWASEMDKFVAYMERFDLRGKLKKKYRKETHEIS